MGPKKQWRVALTCLALLLILIAFLSLFISDRIRANEKAKWEQQVLTTAQLIASQLQSSFLTPAEKQDLDQRAQSSSKILGMDVIILDSRGQVLASPSGTEDLSLPDQIASQALSDAYAAQTSNDSISAATAIEGDQGEILGLVYVRAPRAFFQSSLKWLPWLIPAALVIIAAGVWIFSFFLQDRYRKRTEMMTIAAEQMQRGNFQQLQFPKTDHALGDLNRALQVMAEQLGDQIEALTGERAKLSAVLDQMTDGVLIADSQGRVQLLNPTAENLFGIENNSGVGKSVVEVLRHHQLVDLWREANQGKRQSTMLEIGSQHLFLQVVGIPLKSSLPGSTLLLFQDLTQLRRLETVRRDFISNVSHELRSPLASLKALAETLQEGALEDPPAARRFILRMETEIDNMTQLVNELLELSRIESGKVPISFRRIQPKNLLMPAYERMILQAERAGLDLTVECQTELPAVFADPDRITQVMINLLHNAIKFTPPGGKITLSAYQEGEYIVFFVRDTGVGIARKDLGRIFERFYKADRARAGGGTGLGLSIARHIIESHGGYIWAESDEGVGSTMYFSLPIA